MSHAEQEMDDCDSLPGVKRQDACVTIEKGDGESFLSMQESSTRIPNEALTLEEQASTNTYSEPFPQQLNLQRLLQRKTWNHIRFMFTFIPNKTKLHSI